jgi:hypothetical protein
MKITKKQLIQMIKEEVAAKMTGGDARKAGIEQAKTVATGTGIDPTEKALINNLHQAMLDVAGDGTALKTGRLKTLYDRLMAELAKQK